MLTAGQILHTLKLEPLHGEGGLFIQSYKSAESIPPEGLPERYPKRSRAFGTAIYYLLTSELDSFSAMHVLPTDEVYHFYLGDPVEMLLLFEDGASQHVVLGQDILNGEKVQFTVPRNVWQGSSLIQGGRFALLGTTMAPGYEDSDYIEGIRQELIEQFPQERDLITHLTRK